MSNIIDKITGKRRFGIELEFTVKAGNVNVPKENPINPGNPLLNDIRCRIQERSEVAGFINKNYRNKDS